MKYYQITDAAKKVDVESHVLRYWEEELELPIERNKQGHRLYTEEDLKRFLYIKELKKEGLQLRAIRARVHPENFKEEETKSETQSGMAISAVALQQDEHMREERAAKLCMMLQQMVGQAVRKENQEMMSELKRSVADTVSKEMNYQFRIREQREEEHFQKIDALLREKSGRKRLFRSKTEQEQIEKEKTKEQKKQKKTKAEKEKEMLLARKQQEEETKSQ